jgi:UDP-N-acetylmuramyl pentapeptide phosphotransferase/UDP-N-acetylglucosamine-1-phosphate transferase
MLTGPLVLLRGQSAPIGSVDNPPTPVTSLRMTPLVLSFIVSFLATFLAIRSSGSHERLSADHDLSGPQKFHHRPVPRIGGAGILLAGISATLVAVFLGQPEARLMGLLIACSLPAFLAGLAEDLTKSLSPRRRLFFTAVSAAMAAWLLDAVLIRTAIPGVDFLMMWTPFAIALTVFVVSGVANAVNIIDGFNGLAGMCVLMMLLAIGYVAFQVGDSFILTATLILIGAVLGFFVWNFPAGLIFLGDGGAYFLGFALAELCVLLLHRNPQVSPIFTLLLCGYPIFETIFSIYRKKFLRSMSPGMPDGVHLHMLVYKRLMRLMLGATSDRRRTTRNSMTSPYLWVLCLLSVIPAVLWWDNTFMLTCFLALFMFSYVWLYWSIVRFKTPKWLVFRRQK